MGLPSKFGGAPDWIFFAVFVWIYLRVFILMGRFDVVLTPGCALPVSLSRLTVMKTAELLTDPLRILIFLQSR